MTVCASYHFDSFSVITGCFSICKIIARLVDIDSVIRSQSIAGWQAWSTPLLAWYRLSDSSGEILYGRVAPCPH
jgi:hypothetical protein